MNASYVHYIKKSVIAVAIIYGIGNILYGLSTAPDQLNTPETKVVENTNTTPSHQPTEPPKPLTIDIYSQGCTQLGRYIQDFNNMNSGQQMTSRIAD